MRVSLSGVPGQGDRRGRSCQLASGSRLVRTARPSWAAARTSIARSSRSSVRSQPSATSVSNSGGVAVRPVTATRIAMNRSPAFQPRASASSRSGGSSSSASKLHRAVRRRSTSRAAREALERSSPRPSASARGSPGRARSSSTQRNPTRSPIGAQRRQALLDDRAAAARSSSSAGSAIDPAGVAARPARNGRSRSTRSSGSRRRIHWPFSHSRRSRSKTAPPFWTSLDVEPLDELVEREDLLLGARSTSRGARGS